MLLQYMGTLCEKENRLKCACFEIYNIEKGSG